MELEKHYETLCFAYRFNMTEEQKKSKEYKNAQVVKAYETLNKLYKTRYTDKKGKTVHPNILTIVKAISEPTLREHLECFRDSLIKGGFLEKYDQEKTEDIAGDWENAYKRKLLMELKLQNQWAILSKIYKEIKTHPKTFEGLDQYVEHAFSKLSEHYKGYPKFSRWPESRLRWELGRLRVGLQDAGFLSKDDQEKTKGIKSSEWEETFKSKLNTNKKLLEKCEILFKSFEKKTRPNVEDIAKVETAYSELKSHFDPSNLYECSEDDVKKRMKHLRNGLIDAGLLSEEDQNKTYDESLSYEDTYKTTSYEKLEKQCANLLKNYEDGFDDKYVNVFEVVGAIHAGGELRAYTQYANEERTELKFQVFRDDLRERMGCLREGLIRAGLLSKEDQEKTNGN